MSDFLSNFDKKNYEKTISEKNGKKLAPESHDPMPTKDEADTRTARKKRSSSKPRSREKEIAEPLMEETISEEKAVEVVEPEPISYSDLAEPVEGEFEDVEDSSDEDDYYPEDQPNTSAVVERRTAEVAADDDETTSRFSEEETEIDPTYKKRKRLKIIIFTVIGVIVAIALYWMYYSYTHVAMPKFTGKNISEARAWASENDVKLDVEQKYDFDKEVNSVVKQNVKSGKKIKKKSTVKLVSSLGPDPEEQIPLPDFSKMNKSAADEWVVEHKAENLSILEEYSDTVEKGKFIRQEINDKEIKPESYKREDQAVAYFSKGKETFEKDVPVPDFKGKPKSEVETWVKTNEIKMEYKEVDSDTVAEGMVVSQSVEKAQKVAKRDAMSVEVSTGKAFTVPNFWDYTPETAATAAEGLSVNVKTTFSGDVPYGQLISQSVEAGTKMKMKDLKPVTVTYSAGRPYLRSCFGSLEGDLEKLFFEEYRSKGANITYTTYYVDSSEERGKVVDMSAYNQYVSMDYVVNIAISNGSKASKPSETPATPEQKTPSDNTES